jgi:phosphatidylcholine synthase
MDLHHNGLSTEATGYQSYVNPVQSEATEYTDRHVRVAWAVHALTTSGVIVGFVGLNAVIDGHPRAAILWLVAALLLDGIDGPIARKLDVRNRIPTLDGNSLDLIIDYFTCTIVPVAFLCKFDILPSKTVGPLGFAILFVSALWMSRTDQETADGWFNGFPAEWNMIIPTLYLLHPNPWVTLAVCIVFCALTLSRVEFAHPVSVREHRAISLTFMVAWLGSMVWLAVAQRDVAVARIILIIAPMWTVVQVVMRFRTRAARQT